MDQFEVNSERLKRSILEMGEIGKITGEKGITRLALSEEDRMARDLLVQWLQKESLEIKIDEIGNIFGIRTGFDVDAPPILAGSHLDTVRQAGIFDGAVGVLSALEVIRILNEEDIKTERSIGVACFTNEEGARFQPDMMGSAVFSGIYSLEKALSQQDDYGVSVAESLKNINYKGSDSLVPGFYLELHVEQGPILFQRQLNVGIVEGIQGIAWWSGRFNGEANHAGTTPFGFRKDALLGGAELCCKLNNLAKKLGQNSVSTMGRLSPHPDVINVIPGKVDFTIDFRQFNESLFEKGKKNVEELVAKTAECHGLSFSLEKVADSMPVRFQSSMVNLVEDKAKDFGFSFIRLNSGAGHDAGSLSHICPTSMIFVPSVGGRSHCPEELSLFEDITNGSNLLLHCILDLSV